MHRRTVLTAAAAVPLVLAGAGVTAATATAQPSPSAAPAATGQCAINYVPVGSDRSYATWFFGRTIVRLVNPSRSGIEIQWWSSTSYGDISLAPGQSQDLVRSFAGVRIGMHVAMPYSGTAGVNVTFPIGPC